MKNRGREGEKEREGGGEGGEREGRREREGGGF